MEKGGMPLPPHPSYLKSGLEQRSSDAVGQVLSCAYYRGLMTVFLVYQSLLPFMPWFWKLYTQLDGLLLGLARMSVNQGGSRLEGARWGWGGAGLGPG